MKIDGNSVRPGMVLEHLGALWTVVKTQHVKPGKGGAFQQVEMKNLADGRKLNERFRSSDKVERIRLDTKEFTFLFESGDMLTFMDQTTYEQIEISKEWVGDLAVYLQESMEVTMELYDEKPVAITLPDTVILEVADTEPVVKGQTAANSYKPAVLSNGVRSAIPPFVGIGEKIVVNTEDGSYVRRAD
jgi:elongation factor P